MNEYFVAASNVLNQRWWLSLFSPSVPRDAATNQTESARLISATSRRANNFGIIRLLLAAIVCLVHLEWILPGRYGALAWPTNFGGGRAVDCFFVISGYLIFQSCRRSSSLWSYAKKRLLRLYPGLLAAVLGATVLGGFITTLPLSDYLSLPTLRYVVSNLAFATFAAPTLPGVFQGNPVTFVNGPLWTLKIEVMFYVMVPVFLWLASRIRFETLAIVTYVASVAFRIAMNHLADSHPHGHYEELSRQLPGQLSFFMVGAMIEYHIETFRTRIWWLVGTAAAALLSGTYLLYPAATGIITIWLCVVVPCIDFTPRFGDYSYGLYVTHFPIIQTFAALGVLAAHPTQRTIMVLVVCGVVAALSWHCVERPAMEFRLSQPLSRAAVNDEKLVVQ